MSCKVEALERLREDFESVTGKPFKHFFCLILNKDESTDLSWGHVVNKEIPNSPKEVVLQRTDVDNFYGEIESDFVNWQKYHGINPIDLLADKNKISNQYWPKFVASGKEIDFFPYHGKKGNNQSLVRFYRDDGISFDMVLKESEDVIRQVSEKEMSFVFDFDYTYSAIASLIKAVHLTMFKLVGYSYVMSEPGIHIGKEILGEFFQRHKDDTSRMKKQVLEEYFFEFRNMVRPIDERANTTLKGTLDDSTVLVLQLDFGIFLLSARLSTICQLYFS